MDDRQLEQLAKGLGQRAAEGLDVEATASAVLRRLKAEPIRILWWKRAPVIRSLAAAAVLILTAGILVTNQLGPNGSGAVVGAPVPVELAALSETELEEVFDSLYVEAPVYELADAALGDLTEGELEELLRLMEG